MSRNIKSAIFSALLVLIISYPVLGLKLSTVGISLRVEGATAFELWCIGGAATLVFLWQLLRDRLTPTWAKLPKLPSGSGQIGNFLTLPSTQRWIILAMVMVALVWPFFASRGSVDIATLILIYVMLGLGLNIVVGLAGLLDLGYVGFYAVGAYSYAILSHYFGLSFWMCLPIAGMMAALFGFLLGFPVLRLRGDYLAIVTLGFGEIIRILLRNLTELTGGPNGLSIANENKPTLFGLSFERRVPADMPTFHGYFEIAYNSQYKVIFLYLIALLLVLLTLFLVNRLLRMPIGRAWEALREDEIACRALGLNPTVIKLSAFTIGASLAGFAGSFFAARQGLVTPESFTFIESAMILAIVVLGGMGSQLGVILAAIVMVMLQEMRELSEYRMLIFGLVMIFMMIWRPQGLLPMQRPHLELKR
ncbi:high-affinity branched-chain amino acid ABC transporter permease LivM [Pseudomonas chengduensis]|jgi:branched-chain amino acid transport system permease protein|uniref:L-leucine ABC transporter membrane protein /L-isoleucine ABC transporter membrane protein /L-valine ABC transporter membrane protein n=1 Tax=Ectopseudomonas chengduensis TaxID=489632 RepID=A0A1G6R3J6_9GAMM|nr:MULTISPECIES: high-affinity branched-chain amino acid ABC transporter permease LivM [Pseudomonas]KQO28023.1 leucine/isoleucine/valine transporter permease subunit [Pseudomonas sp. Leaf83]MBP3064313.1 high-affinity branched-chain amino acid ABC transporter permease LivM [Pseudomonas chengduensis]MDH1538424.1 high-affinity branched-chain amino acid ABC transporter permease LivM [Pseudomonas chengduensis]NNB75610.1 high-affinity branched-chain amino acid ABC transporter permease LivM [Pseudomon